MQSKINLLNIRIIFQKQAKNSNEKMKATNKINKRND